MKIIKPYVELMHPIDGDEFLKSIERAGRVCYKSEDRITETSAPKFVKMLIDRGHEAMIEHAPSISVKFVCDRGVSHEIVRHRLFSFAQESTRYCNYSGKGIVFILPCWFDTTSLLTEIVEGYYSVWPVNLNCLGRELNPTHITWLRLMLDAEAAYNTLIKEKWTPQQARSVLPNSLKTELIVTGNVREWRHFFKLRTAKDAHPQMQEVANMALALLKEKVAVLFDGI